MTHRYRTYLLACLWGEGLAAQSARIRVELDVVRRRIEDVVGKAFPRTASGSALSPRAKSVDLAMREARNMA
jgi:hypothetical protein